MDSVLKVSSYESEIISCVKNVMQVLSSFAAPAVALALPSRNFSPANIFLPAVYVFHQRAEEFKSDAKLFLSG